MKPIQRHFDSSLLASAKAGDPSAQAHLFQVYESYLLLLARVQINRKLRGRVSPSDVVQSVFLKANQRFAKFRGNTEPEFAAWLRRILASQLVSNARRHLAQRRDARLERAWDAAVDQSSMNLAHMLAENRSPSQQAINREQSVLLAEALDRLPDHYREVIVLRHLEGMGFPEIAIHLDKTVASVKSTWARAVVKLRIELNET